jgi:2-oxo-3-hexenedioate decarboxylase
MYDASGAKALGRKIGFTNRTIWAQYGVYAPIWGYVFDRTAHDLATVEALPLAPFSEPRIEPEIVFGLAATPSAQMDETALMSCIAWVALGFEIVQSIFPGWRFSAADTIAANAVHGALLIGPRHPFTPRAAEWQRTLSRFEIDLNCNGQLIDRGRADNVLGGRMVTPGGPSWTCRTIQIHGANPRKTILWAAPIYRRGDGRRVRICLSTHPSRQTGPRR